MWRQVTIGILLVYTISNAASIQVDVKRPSRDTYLKALENSHGLDLGRDEFNSGHPTGYEYNSPQPTYGAPAPTYGPPVYGPPMMMMYGTPHKSPENWLLDKFKFKLDFYTIGKIILKLVIFKKIVKFIALLCLLLFLPSLKAKFENHGDNENGDDDMRRSLKENDDAMTRFALTAINSFAKKSLQSCKNDGEYYCRFESMVDDIDELYPYQRIVKMYKPYMIMEPVQEDNDNKSSNGEAN